MLRSRRTGLRTQLLVPAITAVVLTAALLAGLAAVQTNLLADQVQRDSASLAARSLNSTSDQVLTTVRAQAAAVDERLDTGLRVSLAALTGGAPAALGEPRRWTVPDPATGQDGSVDLPALVLGGRPLDQVSDLSTPVPGLDDAAALTGTQVTVLQRVNGVGDMLSVASTSNDGRGQRAVSSLRTVTGTDGAPDPFVSALSVPRAGAGRQRPRLDRRRRQDPGGQRHPAEGRLGRGRGSGGGGPGAAGRHRRPARPVGTDRGGHHGGGRRLLRRPLLRRRRRRAGGGRDRQLRPAVHHRRARRRLRPAPAGARPSRRRRRLHLHPGRPRRPRGGQRRRRHPLRALPLGDHHLGPGGRHRGARPGGRRPRRRHGALHGARRPGRRRGGRRAARPARATGGAPRAPAHRGPRRGRLARPVGGGARRPPRRAGRHGARPGRGGGRGARGGHLDEARRPGGHRHLRHPGQRRRRALPGRAGDHRAGRLGLRARRQGLGRGGRGGRGRRAAASGRRRGGAHRGVGLLGGRRRRRPGRRPPRARWAR